MLRFEVVMIWVAATWLLSTEFVTIDIHCSMKTGEFPFGLESRAIRNEFMYPFPS